MRIARYARRPVSSSPATIRPGPLSSPRAVRPRNAPRWRYAPGAAVRRAPGVPDRRFDDARCGHLIGAALLSTRFAAHSSVTAASWPARGLRSRGRDPGRAVALRRPGGPRRHRGPTKSSRPGCAVRREERPPAVRAVRRAPAARRACGPPVQRRAVRARRTPRAKAKSRSQSEAFRSHRAPCCSPADASWPARRASPPWARPRGAASLR